MDRKFSNQVKICGTVESARETESRVGNKDVKAVVARVNTGHGTVNCWAAGSIGNIIMSAYSRKQPVEIGGFLRNGKQSHYYVRTTYAAFSPKELNMSEVSALATLTSVQTAGKSNITLVEAVNSSYIRSSESIVKTYIRFLTDTDRGRMLQQAGTGSTIAITGHFSSRKKGETWYTNITPDDIKIVRPAQKKITHDQPEQQQKAPEKPLFNGKTTIQDFISSVDEQNNIVFQEAFRLRSMAEQIKKQIGKTKNSSPEDVQKQRDDATQKLIEAAKIEGEWADSFAAQMSTIAEHYTRKAAADGTAKDEIAKEAFRAFISKRLDINGCLMPNYCGMAPGAKRKPTFDDFYEDAKLEFKPSMSPKNKQANDNLDVDYSLSNSR